MTHILDIPTEAKPQHPWLHKLNITFVPGPMTPLLKKVADNLLERFRHYGHEIQPTPVNDTDLILTTAQFGEAVNWRQAMLLTARSRFQLEQTPIVYTLVSTTPEVFQQLVDHFGVAIAKERPDPADFAFPGLASQAYRTLYNQGQRGGAILVLERLVQIQSKCIHVLLLVGDEHPQELYHFDLVGAHPRSVADDMAGFVDDIVLRIVTTLCSSEVTEHQVVGEPIPYSEWQKLGTPSAMREAAQQMGKRNFFTEMVRIDDLVNVPSVGDTIANQYSEGCFATWDPMLEALVATVTGSARPLNKDNVTENDLAVIVGVRPDGKGVQVRHVEGKDNTSPSSESVEMMILDRNLPRITLGPSWNIPGQVPVARSKLHGHRGVAGYNPRRVEFVPLPPAYYHYLVSCATDAQARGIEAALAQSEALQNPQDPRQVVFTILPGHGTFIVEKWVAEKSPFQVIWEYMEADDLQITNYIPQGPLAFVLDQDGMMRLQKNIEAPGEGAVGRPLG